jgi:hypothetical protein
MMLALIKIANLLVNQDLLYGGNQGVTYFKDVLQDLSNRQNAQENVNHYNRRCLTAIFAFTPNSANPSSIPALKSYALSIINNERINFHLQPLRQGADISADSQQIETPLSVITSHIVQIRSYSAS